jgi:hypothetical protein
MLEAILATLRETWSGYLDALRLVLPRLLSMLSVVAVGWLIAAAARTVVTRLLGWLGVAKLAERTRAAEMLRKAELPPLDRLTGELVFWGLFTGFLLAGLDALGFRTLGNLSADISHLVPRVVASLAILAVGLVLANLVWRVVLLAAVNAGWLFARALSGGVHALLVTLAVAMALDQLGVARSIVLAAFAISFGALMLALALALGIGAAPTVGRMIEGRLAARGQPRDDGSSHL